MNTQHRNAAIEKIARVTLGVETLEIRDPNNMDFHDMGVWAIRTALEAAYNAGCKSVKSRRKNHKGGR